MHIIFLFTCLLHDTDSVIVLLVVHIYFMVLFFFFFFCWKTFKIEFRADKVAMVNINESAVSAVRKTSAIAFVEPNEATNVVKLSPNVITESPVTLTQPNLPQRTAHPPVRIVIVALVRCFFSCLLNQEINSRWKF